MPLQKYTDGIYSSYKTVLREIELKAVVGFENFFRSHPPALGAPGYRDVEITVAKNFEQVWGGRGFYMIASDFQPELDGKGCHLKIDGLPVIYRGHADKVKERVQSHLDNTRYRKMKATKNAPPWTRCIKLDRNPGDGGIDFEVGPYKDFRWLVLVLPLRESETKFRDCVEWGFDCVFGKPIASNERKQAPSKSALDEVRYQLISVN